MAKITVSVIINSSIDKVWNQLNNPKDIEQWNQASADWHCMNASNDLKVGGTLKSTMAAKDGSSSFDYEAIYDTIIPNELIKYHLLDGRMVEISFQETTNQVLVTETFDAENQNSEELQKAGWQAILNSFKKHVENN
ncbi:SRPBCC domain-containing protein [Flavobacterium sp. CBA20B-1]|uniref:SRPBCC domain-containing protein n=1 Tax=Paenimyroides aestuarii TaxID=2968490 RepID=A0ABY5NSJ3_9FLAO|nr:MULTISPECIES: SRPBCC domain-containing protein [Flavobacteriaceae]UUV21545.1 SRPBCC domain-containing protein [Paenimyroides aestuarii]WCM41798.1 SRPBCC domain-containing protein [Flavobacterium sp. CBA20B-1]